MDHDAASADSPLAGIDPAAAPAASAPASGTAPPADPLPEPDFGYAPPDHYDPAEYRWVPVKRVPRYDGWTEEKQRRFIEVLADTGLVSRAARDVGMSREAAYRLRRAPHAAAFACAWDRARDQAGALVEDVAFERAFEGVETEIYGHDGALKGSKTVYNDRLLTFLLRHLKPERYGTVTQMRGAAWPHQGSATQAAAGTADLTLPAPSSQTDADPQPEPATLDAALRAMEPQLPAPAEELLDAETLEDELILADAAEGRLPRHLAEQRRRKSTGEQRAEYLAALHERGRQLAEDHPNVLLPPGTEEDMAAYCLYFDPTQAREIPRKWRTPK